MQPNSISVQSSGIFQRMETRANVQQPNSNWAGSQPTPGNESHGQQFTTVRPSTDHIRDYLPWSIFTCLCLNCCCVGLAALVFSVKSRNRKETGDLVEATSYGTNARTLNIVSTVLSLIFIIVIIVLQATGVIHIWQHK